MILLDAAPLLALFLDEPAAERVALLLGSGQAAITSVNAAEVLDIAVRRHGGQPQTVTTAFTALVESTLPVVDVGAAEAYAGAEIRQRRYHRREAALSMIDCLLLGAAAVRGCEVATLDRVLAATASAEGIGVVPLGDNTKRRR